MIKKKHVLLDSCIVQHLLSKDKVLSNNASQLIQNLTKNLCTLYISQFTIYEIYRSANDQQKIKVEEILQNFICIEHSVSRQKRAIQLYSEYQKIPEIKNRMHSISDCDVFIGSLIFTEEEPILLTCDYHDFPRPYFNEVETTYLEKKNGNKELCYFFQASLEIF